MRNLIAPAALATLATLATLTLSGVSTAADLGVSQIIVRYGDLNLSHSEGAAALYSRLRAAAGYLCRSVDERDLASLARSNDCIHAAVEDAVVKVNRPALFALYYSRNGLRPPLQLSKADRHGRYLTLLDR